MLLGWSGFHRAEGWNFSLKLSCFFFILHMFNTIADSEGGECLKMCSTFVQLRALRLKVTCKRCRIHSPVRVGVGETLSGFYCWVLQQWADRWNSIHLHSFQMAAKIWANVCDLDVLINKLIRGALNKCNMLFLFLPLIIIDQGRC